MNQKVQSISWRFVKGAIAGAAGTAGASIIVLKDVKVWSDLNMALSMIALMLLIGAISGSLLALEKYATWNDGV